MQHIAETIEAVRTYLAAVGGSNPVANAALQPGLGWRPHLLEVAENRAWHVITDQPTSEFWVTRLRKARTELTTLRLGIAGPADLIMTEPVLTIADELSAEVFPFDISGETLDPRGGIYGSAADLIYTDRIALTSDALSVMMDRWLDRITTGTDSTRKGVNLEIATALLLSQVQGYEVAHRGISSRTQQMDVLVHNRNAGGMLGQGPLVIAECKNWNYPVGRVEYDALYRKLMTRRGMARLGLLVATDRFARTVYEESLRDSTGPQLIVLIDGSRFPNLWRSPRGVTSELESLVLQASVDQHPSTGV